MIKQLETSFVYNADHTGPQTFELVKRCEKAAIYKRTRPNGQIFAFEAFRIRIVPAGTALPGGLVVEQSYEKYPRKDGFGKWGACTKTLESAEKKYDTIVKELATPAADADSEVDADSDEPAIIASATPGKKGRKMRDRGEIKFPPGKFTMLRFVEHNAAMGVSQGFLYQFLQSVMGSKVKVVDTIPGRGKPKMVYEAI
jgi:hypothetical protein